MKYFELQILYERCYTNKVFLTNNSEFFGAKRKEGSSPILHGEKTKVSPWTADLLLHQSHTA